VTKQFPKLSLFLAGEDPSCCHAAPNTLIFSFRVSRGCDLRRPVVDSVADGTLAA
jgi:hypothetical protein